MLAIIGTAGRSNQELLTRDLWNRMVEDVVPRVTPNTHVVSGGAAWADHLAVLLLIEGLIARLTLHLPAPFDGHGFAGPPRSAASAANYYHERFSNVIGFDTLEDINLVLLDSRVTFTEEPFAEGYAAMFARNRKVATAARSLIAYTFGQGDQPADGGTKNTWDLCRGEKTHVSLLQFL